MPRILLGAIGALAALCTIGLFVLDVNCRFAGNYCASSKSLTITAEARPKITKPYVDLVRNYSVFGSCYTSVNFYNSGQAIPPEDFSIDTCMFPKSKTIERRQTQRRAGPSDDTTIIRTFIHLSRDQASAIYLKSTHEEHNILGKNSKGENELLYYSDTNVRLILFLASANIGHIREYSISCRGGLETGSPNIDGEIEIHNLQFDQESSEITLRMNGRCKSANVDGVHFSKPSWSKDSAYIPMSDVFHIKLDSELHVIDVVRAS